MAYLNVEKSLLQRVAIWGAGGHGRVVVDVLRCRGDREPVCFIDDSADVVGATVDGLPVFSPESVLGRARIVEVDGVIPALGTNAVRWAKFNSILEADLEVPSAIHPTAIISLNCVSLGRGVQAMARVIVNTGATIGDNVILNTGSIIEHDCVIEDHSFIGPGVVLGGGVHVGRGAFLGIGTMVKPFVHIGRGTMTGVGAVVVKDLPPGVLAVGVPARPVRNLLLPEFVEAELAGGGLV